MNDALHHFNASLHAEYETLLEPLHALGFQVAFKMSDYDLSSLDETNDVAHVIDLSLHVFDEKQVFCMELNAQQTVQLNQVNETTILVGQFLDELEQLTLVLRTRHAYIQCAGRDVGLHALASVSQAPLLYSGDDVWLLEYAGQFIGGFSSETLAMLHDMYQGVLLLHSRKHLLNTLLTATVRQEDAVESYALVQPNGWTFTVKVRYSGLLIGLTYKGVPLYIPGHQHPRFGEVKASWWGGYPWVESWPHVVIRFNLPDEQASKPRHGRYAMVVYWKELEALFGFTKAHYKAANMLHPRPLDALKACRRHVETSIESIDLPGGFECVTLGQEGS